MTKGTCLVYARRGYTLRATDNCFQFEFNSEPHLADITYRLGDGSLLNVGDCFTRLRGAKTSAGFRDLHLVSGWIEYAGGFSDGEGWYLLFRYSEWPDPLLYVGFAVVGVVPLTLAFSTPSAASRLVETMFVDRKVT